MKFLHTSDWHLGKLFHEKSLIEDQKHVLNQILERMQEAYRSNSPYAALVVSGDIYDRAMPPSEAVTLLNDFLVRITETVPGVHVFMNSGNHDSATRLSFAAEFLKKHNIHIATNTEDMLIPVIVEQGNEKIAFYQLPFLTPLSIKSHNPEEFLRTQQQLYSEACSKIAESHKKNYGNMPAVLNAHVYSMGSITGASERTNVGAVEQVDVSVFKDFAYGAFGHIHKFQVCDKNKRCYYPGALLAYNFDDDPESGILEVELNSAEETPVVKRLFFNVLHPVVKITAEMKQLVGSEADKKLVKENSENYVQVILTDKVTPSEAFANLKTVFPNLLSVSLKKSETGEQNYSIQQRKAAIKSNDPEKIFMQFMKDVYGNSAEDELQQKEKEIFVEAASNMKMDV